jgi:cobalt-zinc-cadmium efflux system outer membrane protein
MSGFLVPGSGNNLCLKISFFCLTAFLSVLPLGGCMRYRPSPLEAPNLEAQYRARNLTDPGLRQFLLTVAPQLASEWPPRLLNLGTATLAAAYFSPELDVARSQIGKARAAMITAGAPMDPSLEAEPGYNSNPEAHVLFSIAPRVTIETAGKRSLRVLQARRNLEAARLGLAEAAWRVQSQVRQAFYEQLLSSGTLDLLHREEAIRTEIVDIFDKRLSAGEAARPEYDLFRVDLIHARAETKRAQGMSARSRVLLANSMGIPASALEGMALDARGLDTPPDESSLPLAGIQRAGLMQRIDIQRMLVEYSAAEAALEIEIARQRPNIELGIGYAFEEGFNRYIFPASIPLAALFQRNRGPIAEAEARRQEIQQKFISLQAAAIGEFDLALAQYRAALAALEESGVILTVERERESAALRFLEAGETDRLEVATARLRSVTAERARLDALQQVRVALGALENAVQQPLEDGLSLPASEAGPKRENNP